MKQLRLFFKMRQISNRLWRVAWLIALMLWAQTTWAQTAYTISGKATEQGSGAPVPGALVTIVNTNFATITDADGNYQLKATLSPSEYQISIRVVGYTTITQTILLGNPDQTNSTVDFMLSEDLMKLDEVVITGASVATSRKQLGNFIGTVDAKDIKDIATVNPLAALSGRVLGAQVTQNSGDPGGGFSVRMRGVSTINGSAEPLYIIDGVIVDNSSRNVINLNADAQSTGFQAGQNRLIDLNPNDIERIEVVNGAAGAAIYGSLASNGVVQIFTKRGKEGKPRVTFSSAFSVSQLRKRLEFNTYGRRFGIRNFANPSPRLSSEGDRLTMVGDFRALADRQAQPGTGPALNPDPNLFSRLMTQQYDVQRYDYQDNLFHTALGVDNYLSVTGGTDKTSYFASASYSNNDGIIVNSNFQRYGVRFRLDQRFGNYVKVSAGASYNNSKSKDFPNGNNFFNPISSMIIIDNVWNIAERDAFGRLLLAERARVNPLSIIETFDITQETNRFIGDIKTTIMPIKGLSIDYTLGLDTYSLVGNTLQPRLPYNVVAGDVANGFFPDGYVSVATNNVLRVNNDWVATYQASIGKSFSSTTTLGAQLIYNKSKSTAIEGRDLQDFVTTVRAARNFFNLPTEVIDENSIWGYFLQQTFGYKDYLFLTLAGRIDGSSVFGKDQRNQFYPKIGASFVLSETEFWKNANLKSVINSFKLRASYGEAGNLTAIGSYERFTNAAPVVLTGRGGFQPNSNLGEENIRPERKKEFEIGTDLSLFNNRFGIQFNYYRQDIEDLILQIFLAPSSGGSTISTNIGKMENRGIELMLSGTPVKNANFRWDVSWLLSTYKNVVRNIGGTRAGFSLRGGGGTQSIIEGQPMSVFFGAQYARNADGSLLLRPDGNPQVERGNDVTGVAARDGNGQPTGTPVRRILGDTNPDYSSSLINEVTYKKFSLRIQFDAMGGFQVYNWNRITSNNVGASKLAERELRGELPRGWVAAIGGQLGGQRIQEEHVEDGDFVKLREIAFTYNIGKVIKGIDNLSLSLVGRNLISWDNYQGYDPETNSAGQSTRVRGDDFGNVPIPRMYQLKLTASF
ncbi:MAG: SusC/RagA family TonB-linked outer membrane protein [Microscillaceae bacterium]|jgi:TonB-linked SusC/RagA family outer membrane protein|nr:SusC/RagA family TonB-linked outer membrane protein [Microscillaceae bacterium]